MDEILQGVVRTFYGAGLVWQACVVAVLGVIVIVLLRRFGPPLGVALVSVAAKLHSVKPEPDPLEKPPSPPMDMPAGGMTIPGPPKEGPWNSP